MKALAELLQYGAPPHAGCAIGLERLLMAYFNLFNVRYLSLFPRTAERMAP
jgi:aspartyl-tRNA synthetase